MTRGKDKIDFDQTCSESFFLIRSGGSYRSFTSSVKWLRSSTQSVKRLPFLPEERKNRMLYLPPFPEGRTGLIELSLTCFLFPWDGMSFAKWIGEKARSDPMIPDPFML